MTFRYEALNRGGTLTRATVDAPTPTEAAAALRDQGLMVLKLDEVREKLVAVSRTNPFERVGPADLLLFARQMKMLLESGAALVPALDAIEQQTRKARFRQIVRDLRIHIENGGTLTDAMRAAPRVFSSVFTSMVASGEATGTLPRSFSRLADLTQRQQHARRAVVGAAIYPAVLSMMCVSVGVVMVSFVIPRFRLLFTNLRAKLPATTQTLFAAADFLGAHWPLLLGALGAVLVALLLVLRQPVLRARLDALLLATPLLGGVLARLEAARVFRILAVTLRSNVPLLDALAHARASVRTSTFRRLIENLEETVSAGGKIGEFLLDSRRVDPVFAAAITTGENNGRLAESVEFVSTWVDEDNHQLISSATRLAEPVMLSLMGLFVGIVATALFIPLFDLAGAA